MEDADAGRRTVLRRSHLEIRMHMLRAVQEGAEGPTQIMYRANLSWSVLREHLQQLLLKGFLAETTDGARRKYGLTAKGSGIVASYFKIAEEMQVQPTFRKLAEW